MRRGKNQITFSFKRWIVLLSVIAWVPLVFSQISVGQAAVTPCQTTPMIMESDVHEIQGSLDTTDCTSTKYGLGHYADYYTFEGSAGDRISIAITAAFNRNIVLYDPNGGEVQDEDVRIPYGGWYTLQVTGTYILEVTSYQAGLTGGYTLTSVKRSAKVNGMCGTKTPITIGCSPIITPGNLETDDCVSFKYGINWYADYYTFTGSVGDRISISITASFNRNIVLYDPNGGEVQDEDVRIPGAGWYTLLVTGPYTLEVTSYNAGQTGGYTLTIVSSDTTPPIPGPVTPYNVSSGSFLDRPFNLKTTFTDNESTVTSCEYTTDYGVNGEGAHWETAVVSGTKPNFTCTKTGITGTDGQTLTLNMRATSGGCTNTATPVTRTVDAVPPTDGTLTLLPSNGQVLLNWTTASDSRSGLRTTNPYKVMRKTGTYPSSKCADGDKIYQGDSNSVVDDGLTNGTTYYYRVCAYDKVNNVSNGTTAKVKVNWVTKKITNNAGNSEGPSIAVDGQNIYVVWQDDTITGSNLTGDSEIYFRKSEDGGYNWITSKRLTNNTGDSTNPSIAVNGMNIYVDSPGNPEAYFRMSTDGGDSWGASRRLTYNAGASTNPSIAVDGLNVYVVWQDDIVTLDNPTGDSEIYFRESNDGGSTWQVPQPLTNNTGSSLSPRIAVSGSNVYVAWKDNTPGNYEIFMKKSANGGATWSTNKRLSNNASTSLNPSIAVNDSNVYVTWEDNIPGNYEIYFKKSVDGETIWTKNKNLSNNSGNSLNPSIAVNGLNVYVVWEDDTPGNPEIYFRESIDGGTTWATTENRSNNTGNSLSPSIAVDGSDPYAVPYAVWSDNTPGNPEIFVTY